MDIQQIATHPLAIELEDLASTIASSSGKQQAHDMYQGFEGIIRCIDGKLGLEVSTLALSVASEDISNCMKANVTVWAEYMAQMKEKYK